MKKFSERPFDQRFSEMGDESESVYEAVKPFGNTIRFGFRRPKGISFRKLPKTIAHMPDYMTETYLVEVMGLGRDGVLKSVKVEKYESLKVWAKVAAMIGLKHGVWSFVWNSATSQFAIIPWGKLIELVAKSKKQLGIKKFEEDGNEYYPLPWEWLIESAAWVGTHDAR